MTTPDPIEPPNPFLAVLRPDGTIDPADFARAATECATAGVSPQAAYRDAMAAGRESDDPHTLDEALRRLCRPWTGSTGVRWRDQIGEAREHARLAHLVLSSLWEVLDDHAEDPARQDAYAAQGESLAREALTHLAKLADRPSVDDRDDRPAE